MKKKLMRYGKFKTADGYEHCVAVIQYEDIFRCDPYTNKIEKVGERVINVCRIRGGLNYAKKHGFIECGYYKSISHLIDDDRSVYKNLNIEFYEPIPVI